MAVLTAAAEHQLQLWNVERLHLAKSRCLNKTISTKGIPTIPAPLMCWSKRFGWWGACPIWVPSSMYIAVRVGRHGRVRDKVCALWKVPCLWIRRREPGRWDEIPRRMFWSITWPKYRGDRIEASIVSIVHDTEWISSAFSGKWGLIRAGKQWPFTWCSFWEVCANWVCKGIIGVMEISGSELCVLILHVAFSIRSKIIYTIGLITSSKEQLCLLALMFRALGGFWCVTLYGCRNRQEPFLNVYPWWSGKRPEQCFTIMRLLESAARDILQIVI